MGSGFSSLLRSLGWYKGRHFSKLKLHFNGFQDFVKGFRRQGFILGFERVRRGRIYFKQPLSMYHFNFQQTTEDKIRVYYQIGISIPIHTFDIILVISSNWVALDGPPQERIRMSEENELSCFWKHWTAAKRMYEFWFTALGVIFTNSIIKVNLHFEVEFSWLRLKLALLDYCFSTTW